MRILRPSDTASRIGLCDRQLREMEAAGLFPKRFQINPGNGRACGHLEIEVERWIKERADTRNFVAA